MDIAVAALLGLLIGVLATTGVCRLLTTARVAALGAERVLLRERVADLEDALAEDARTASALAPLGDALRRVETQVGTLERDRTHQFAALESTITQVQQATSTLGRQTQTLAGSLNASTVRGAWGEVQLRRVLEHAGMLARCDFDEQVSAVSRHERQVRPDVVVRLPGQKFLVVDAKSPMDAFLKAQGEDLAPAERTSLLRSHALALKSHVTSLAAKDYWSAFEASPEMVVCFVPTEAMLSTALGADPGLLEVAMAQRVVLVGPATLMALLRTVAFTWQQDVLTANAQELLALGKELHARLATLGGHVAKMGGSLQRSIEAYNAMVGTLETRVLVTARRMNDLGLVDADIAPPVPLQSGPRVLTAAELLDHVCEAEARPALDFAAPDQRPDQSGSRSTA